MAPFARALAPGTAARLLARAGRRSRGRVPTAAKWERGVIAGLAVTCNAMRRQRLAIGMGQVRSLPGDGRPGPRHPAARTSFAMS